MAKLMSDPAGMVCAWKQVGLLMGYYSPERVRVDVNVGAVGQAELGRMNQMSDAELVRIMETGRAAYRSPDRSAMPPSVAAAKPSVSSVTSVS